MNIKIKSFAFPLVFWAFFALLGGVVGLNVPFVLLVIATILYIVS